VDRRPYKTKEQKTAPKKKGSSMSDKKQSKKTSAEAEQPEEEQVPSTFPHSAIPGDEGSPAQRGQQLEEGAEVETFINPNTDPRVNVAADHPAGWPVIQQKPKE
jgi:hypothetical protein